MQILCTGMQQRLMMTAIQRRV